MAFLLLLLSVIPVTTYATDDWGTIVTNQDVSEEKLILQEARLAVQLN